MRAAVMRQSAIVVDTVPDPTPGPGEMLVRTLACGICGSDLHALRHAGALVEAARASGTPMLLDPTRDVVLGHEFCAEVLDYGPDTPVTVPPGRRVVCMPVVFRGGALHGIGYSNEVPGGYGERMVLPASLALEVPNGLATEHAALTEPMAVGLHAVEKARLGPHDAALVYGCGPVGLAVVAALALRHVEPIVAADFSPLRRRLALAMGAHAVVDPAERPAIDAYRELADLRPTVLFECVGVPGVLDQMMRHAPLGSRIVVAGVCMERDTIWPMIGINKELNLQFVFAYQPQEFAATLEALADGRLRVDALITGRVGVDGVAQAFCDLERPDAHAKILVEPWR
ncbi:MAG TPA: zinc-binding dehydrogenase [Candidatus Limnocylindria bacterium]|nr:zinc-binding dehydrogenase [Candidatus Limnocylindria bacterium]